MCVRVDACALKKKRESVNELCGDEERRREILKKILGRFGAHNFFSREREKKKKKEEENLGFRVEFFSRKAKERGNKQTKKDTKNFITFKACANVYIHTYVVKESRREEEERDITHAQRVDIYIYN